MKDKKDEKEKTGKQREKARKETQGLEEQMEKLQKDKDELFAKLQRLGADYDNFQKRTARQIADAVAYEKEAVIKTLLPALDSFEHTLANSEKAESVEVLAKGVQIVYDQILGVLKSHGVEQINAEGQMFDPSVHEAMQQRAEPDKEDGVVLEEYQKGYRLGGRVIRPSRVVVNKVPGAEPASEQEEAAEGGESREL